MMRTFEYDNVEVLQVVDGDTLDVRITHDCGFKIKTTFETRVRLFGINAPEMHGATKEAGIAAKAHLYGLVDQTRPLVMRTVKDKGDKYGRFLATIIGHADGEPYSINDRMVRDGFAVPYEV